MLALKNIHLRHGKKEVLSGASLDIGPKDSVCIVGAAGSGKTTIAGLLIGALKPTSGTVAVDGINMQTVPHSILQLYRRRTGIIFQEPMLLLHATVFENISLPLELFGSSSSAIHKAATDLLGRLGLKEKADELASSLSSSERMMLHIGRALIASPMILIADEPFALLDEEQTANVVELLTNMHAHGTTLILLSNTEDTAKLIKARTAHLEDGTIKAAKHTAKTSAKNTHHILEEEKEIKKEGHEKEHAQKKPPVGTPKDANKIKITSIGSGLS